MVYLNNWNKLEKIQIQAARVAIGATKLISINALYNETQWETLQQRRQNHQLLLFYTMSNNLIPNYLLFLIPQHVGAISRYNLRNSYDLQTLEAKTKLYNHFFLPIAIRGWNSLSEELRSCDSISSFEHQL